MSVRHQRLTMRRLEQEARELHAREFAGETAATPILSLTGVLLFLVIVLALVLGASLAAYYIG